VDPIYQQGWDDGWRAFKEAAQKVVTKIKRADRDTRRNADHVDSILRDPEKLIEEALRDSQIASALTTAVLGMLMAEGGVTPSDLLPK
jgi:hypothetical protein